MNTTTRDHQEIVDELGEIQSQILELVEQQTFDFGADDGAAEH